MSEIGGYLELETSHGSPYHNGLAMNTARASLLFLIENLGIRKVFLPYYLCNSVSDYLNKNNINYDFYHIDESFVPIFSKSLKKDEFLLVVNTFGQLNSDAILQIKNVHNNIILDNTHSFFKKPLSDTSTIYSCRKFFGVPDGSYLYFDVYNDYIISNYNSLMYDKSKMRINPLIGRIEDSASMHYSEYVEIENSFANIPPLRMSKLSQRLMEGINYNVIIDIRNNNFDYYAKALNEYNTLFPTKLNGPFCYPFYIENGEFLRKKLLDHKIYIPTLWSNVTRENGASPLESNMAVNLLPLPVNQRISVNDIDLIVNLIEDNL